MQVPTEEEEDSRFLEAHPEFQNVQDPNIRRELRRADVARREAQQANDRAAQAERRLAFIDAKLPDHPALKGLQASFIGDQVPTVEEIRQRATEWGLINEDGTPTIGAAGPAGDGSNGAGSGAGSADEETLRRIAGAGSSTGTQGGGMDLADALRAAKSNDEVMQILRNAPPEAGLVLRESVAH